MGGALRPRSQGRCVRRRHPLMCCNRPRPRWVGPLPSSGASVAGQGRQSDERGSAHQRLPQRTTQRHPRNQPGCACNPGTLVRIKHRGPLHEDSSAPRVRSLAPTTARSKRQGGGRHRQALGGPRGALHPRTRHRPRAVLVRPRRVSGPVGVRWTIPAGRNHDSRSSSAGTLRSNRFRFTWLRTRNVPRPSHIRRRSARSLPDGWLSWYLPRNDPGSLSDKPTTIRIPGIC
jgi:hypothetical protein